MHPAALLIEIGGVVLGLGIVGTLAKRIGIPAIPVYLLAGLAFGQGGLLPLALPAGSSTSCSTPYPGRWRHSCWAGARSQPSYWPA